MSAIARRSTQRFRLRVSDWRQRTAHPQAGRWPTYWLAAVALLLPSAAWAQDKKLATLNVSGVLTAKDPVHPAKTGCHFKAYDFRMAAGATYLIDMRSTELDAFLRVEDAKGHLLALDDDSGGNRNAHLQYQAPATGTYRIIATTFKAGERGRFTLNAGLASTMPTAVGMSQPIQLSGPGGTVHVWASPQNVTNPPNGQQEETHGYLEYRLVVANDSPTATHRVTVALPRRGGGYPYAGYYVRSITRSLELQPGETSVVSLFQPNLPLAFAGGNLEVTVDGRALPTSNALPIDQQRGRFRRVSNWPPSLFSRSILTSPFLDTELRNRIPISAVGQPGPSGQIPYGTTGSVYNGKPYTYVMLDHFRGATGPMNTWSRHWLGYSSYDGIVLRDGDLHAASPEARSALWRYVECGGALLVLGTAELPAHWQRTGQDKGGRTYYYPGFGACIVASETNLQKWGPEDLRILTTMWGHSARPWQDVESVDAAQQRFPVVDDVGIPIRNLFLVMLVFAVLIGPVNIIVLSRIGRRVWLLWTIPTFSLLTCMAVVAYMTLSADWEGTVRAEGLTILDERTQRATTIGWLALFSPQTPGDGLHFSRDTELSPHVQAWSNNSHPSRTIDWTNDQHLASGWLTARIPAHFLVRTCESRSDHLTLDRRADSLAVTNALGADIRTVWLADADGKLSTTDALPVGGTAVLTPSDRRAAGSGSQLRDAFGRDWLSLVDDLTAEPQKYLRPGCYIAVLDAAPFIPQGLDAATPRRCRAVVFGIMAKR